jgi:IPT/TIG domain/PASTA domain
LKISRIVPSVGLACALVLALASAASAAPIALGPSLSTTTYTPTTCTNTGGCTIAYKALASGRLPASPVDGVITSWSIKGASASAGYALRVLGGSGVNLTGIATSSLATSTGPGLQTFATALPIKQGQLIGFDIPQNAQFGLAAVPGDITLETHPLLPNGTTVAFGEFPGEEVAFSAQVQVAPTVTAISPTGGLPTGGTQVTITGAELEGASAVKFGTVSATAFTVNSETQITAFAPAGTGAVPVSVTTPAGTAVAPQAFTYTAPIVTPAPTCKVPKLKGKTLKSAKKRIRAADCRVGKLTKKEGAKAKTGEIVKQVPKPGTTVAANTKVKITLAP